MTYPGGKGASGVVQTIINQQPPHDIYIEPFLGSGTVMRAKKPARLNIGIDRDRSAIANYADAGSSEGLALVCASAMDWMLDRALDRAWTGRELVYCDPPYPLSVRRSKAPIYKHECDDDASHARLLGYLVQLPCMVQISGYDCPLYLHWLEGWRVIKYQTMTRRGVRTECLWMNYSEPDVLHDYQFLGGDFRVRERIRRKATRWAERLRSLPRLERLAISAELRSTIATFSDGAPDFRLDRTKIWGTSSTDRNDDGRRRRHLVPSPEMAMSTRGDRTSPELKVLQ